MAIADGFKPTAVVNAAGVVRTPVVESKVYVDTEPGPAVDVATNSILPLVASAVGDAGAIDRGQGTGLLRTQLGGMGPGAGCLISVNVPFPQTPEHPIWSMMNTEMLSDPWLATNT